MDAAAKIVVQADDPYAQFTWGDIFCSFKVKLESVSQSMPLAQSMPLVLASLAQESGTMSAEALDQQFEQVIAMLVGMQQRQVNERISATSEQQKMSTSSLPSSEQYLDAIEQRFRQLTDMIETVKKQQHETLLRYESLTSSERIPSLASTENTTSIIS
mmetsp:Transcript_28931/g.52350  ORF Transcript_28931/g.52350 Transcript_28931/m.52350 type:complete len:159 (+) Transcript_28931:195-671(+)